MIIKVHRGKERGYVDHGWLKATHSFSFASYYDPQKIRFGLLRVLNDDIVEAGGGFGTHPHDNMEIVTIPLEGALEHKDSMGNTEVIRPGEVQVMSAGSGITHSEYNHSKEIPVNLLQIWVFPKERDITPRYEQRHFNPEKRKNRFDTIVSPDNMSETSMWINQDAFFSLADLEKGKSVAYDTKIKGNGIYLFVIEGKVSIGSDNLEKRDAASFEETESINITALDDSKLLAIEIPMNQ